MKTKTRTSFVLVGMLTACSAPPPDGSCTGEGCSNPPAAGDMARPPGTVDPACTAPRGAVKKTVVDRFLMPTVNQPCSIDIDGDGRPDNALSAVVAGLRAAAFDIQGNADAVVRTGELVQLISVQTEDPMSSNCAAVALRRGQATEMPPAYDGSDTFKVDEALPVTQLLGTIATGQLETPRPADQSGAQVMRLGLSLPGGFGVEVPLPLLGAHMSARVRNQGLVSGELHGVVRLKDVQERMIPAIAQTMTALVRRLPDSPSAKQIIATFETKAKCDATPDLCCKTKPQSCQITADEVRNNAQTRLILKPDVQMFSGETWAPTAAGSDPDSLSVGLCFTAVTAAF